MAKKQINKSTKTFKGLLTGIIVATAVGLAAVLSLVVLLFTIATHENLVEKPNSGIAGGLFAIQMILYACDITWIVCCAISLVKVDEAKKRINPKNFRILYGIFLGLYVLFGMLGAFFSIPNIFFLILLVAVMVFTIIHIRKLK